MSDTNRPPALLLPALSSIATRDELRPLASRLNERLRCVLHDWPGFGAPALGQLSPTLLDGFLDSVLQDIDDPVIGIAAGHGATYLVKSAGRWPGRFKHLVLIAPTWRGPLPTMLDGRQSAVYRTVRMALEAPGVGSFLFRLNLSRPVVGWMMREHVYADASRVTSSVLDAKLAVAHRPGGRFGTAAFVTGGLDPVGSRAEFLALFDHDLPPVLMLRPTRAPARSAAEMDALADTGRVTVTTCEGALAPYEENTDQVAGLILNALFASDLVKHTGI